MDNHTEAIALVFRTICYKDFTQIYSTDIDEKSMGLYYKR